MTEKRKQNTGIRRHIRIENDALQILKIKKQKFFGNKETFNGILLISVLLYKREGRLFFSQIKRTEASDMWFYIMTLRIPWIEHGGNDKDLKKIKTIRILKPKILEETFKISRAHNEVRGV